MAIHKWFIIVFFSFLYKRPPLHFFLFSPLSSAQRLYLLVFSIYSPCVSARTPFPCVASAAPNITSISVCFGVVFCVDLLVWHLANAPTYKSGRKAINHRAQFSIRQKKVTVVCRWPTQIQHVRHISHFSAIFFFLLTNNDGPVSFLFSRFANFVFFFFPVRCFCLCASFDICVIFFLFIFISRLLFCSSVRLFNVIDSRARLLIDGFTFNILCLFVR